MYLKGYILKKSICKGNDLFSEYGEKDKQV